VPPARLIAPLAGVGLAVALFPATWGLDAVARGALGPGFWPRLALVGLALGCLAKFVEECRRPRPAADADAAEGLPPMSRAKLALGIGAIVLYVVLTPLLGFPLVTALFIAAFMVLCGTRSLTVIAANVGLGTVAFLYLFVKIVYLPLPKGDGPFEALTLALYRALRLF
jgi:putative tricarboxylic transport membrane protein